MSFWQWAGGLCLAGFFSTVCAYCFNKRLAQLAHLREEERHIIRTAERLCDSLMEDVVKYWTTPVDAKNNIEMQTLAKRIGISNSIIYVFIHQNFPRRLNTRRKFKKMVEQVTGGDFGTVTLRGPDNNQAGLASSSIMELRMAISQEAGIKNKLFQQGRS